MSGIGVLILLALVAALVLSLAWRLGKPSRRDGDDTGQ